MEKRQLYAVGQPFNPISGYEADKDELLKKSDIAQWAKEDKKPSYSAEEIGADAAGSAASALASAKTYADNTYMQATGYTNQAIANLIDGAPETLDTLKEIADAMAKNKDVVEALDEAIGSKASEVEFQGHASNETIHITATERREIFSLIDSLKFPDGTHFYADIQDGKPGFNTDPERGADTFIPFSSKLRKLVVVNNETTYQSLSRIIKTVDISSVLPDYKNYNITSDDFIFELVGCQASGENVAIMKVNPQITDFSNGVLTYNFSSNYNKNTNIYLTYNILLIY